MKKILTIALFSLFAYNSYAVIAIENWSKALQDQPEIQVINPEMASLNVDDFLNLTPKKYKEMTGEKLSVKEALQLKAAQKVVKKAMNNEPLDKSIYVLLAIFGLGWLAMGLASDWEGSDWIVNLLLTVLCWLPGLIHALVSMKKYY
jgi:uncharacterized membrane protein YqaE (UPF0057 family)